MNRIGQSLASTPERLRAEELTQAISDDLKSVAETFWRIGERLHEIQTKRLFVELGFETHFDYVQARLDVAFSQAKKMVRIVRNYVRDDAEALGLERAHALIAYAGLVGEDPGLLVRKKASLGGSTVLEASKRDILDATKRLRDESSKKKGRSQAARRAARENKQVTEALKTVLENDGVRAHQITWNRRSDEFVIRIQGDRVRKRYLGGDEDDRS